MDYKRKYRRWLKDPVLKAEDKKELLDIKDENEILDRFYTMLKFGTAGMRGIVGMGENRMNIYTVGKATSAFAKMLLDTGAWVKQSGVAIAYDCRNMSYEFAHRAAGVLNAYGIKVHIYDGIHPVPMLSYAIRHLKCAAGIMITASHNPKEYNGFKVFGSNGAQLEPEDAQKVTNYYVKIKKLQVPYMKIDVAKNMDLFKYINREIEEEYYKKVLGIINRKDIFDRVKDDFSIVYTPLHGAGAGPVVEVLERAGVRGLSVVESQMMPDSNFSTVESPNPEDADALERAIDLAKKKKADLVMATDPDCDRLGAAILTNDGKFMTLSGNQIGILLLNYVLLSKTENKTMPEKPAVVSTVVTSKMVEAVCKEYNVECFLTLTGFKFICGVMEDIEKVGYTSVFGYEESHGYLPANFVRDKDGVQACLVMAEMAAWYKHRGMTPYEGLIELYEKLGYYGEKTVSHYFKGSQGVKTMQEIMKNMRFTMPTEVDGAKVIIVRDYLNSTETNLVTGEKKRIDLHKSNVLSFELDNDTSFIARPSGTEPKVKLYFGAKRDNEKDARKAIDKLDKIIKEMYIKDV